VDNWNPDQYNRFQKERAQPFWDLASRVDFTSARTMLDLGCGTGELTDALHAAKKLKATIAIDSSPAMLAKAARIKTPGLAFTPGDIATYVPTSRFNVVISNSALQWADEHKKLLVKMLDWLEPGGQLAIQMPCNFDHASHFLAADVAHENGLHTRQSPLLAPETYAELLYRHGMRDVDVWIQVYLHAMPSGKDVVEWTKGTLLTYYEQQTDAPTFRKFLADYSKRLLMVTGEGPYLYPFKRIFIYGRKGN
jgi:trans-aconitate 2-methyltransferase